MAWRWSVMSPWRWCVLSSMLKLRTSTGIVMWIWSICTLKWLVHSNILSWICVDLSDWKPPPHAGFWSCVLETRRSRVKAQTTGERHLCVSKWYCVQIISLELLKTYLILQQYKPDEIFPSSGQLSWCSSAARSPRDRNADFTFLCVWRRYCSVGEVTSSWSMSDCRGC